MTKPNEQSPQPKSASPARKDWRSSIATIVGSDLFKSVFDKLVLAALIFVAGWVWTHVVEADRTFWKEEADRLKAESELLVKLAPPSANGKGESSFNATGVHASALVAMAKNGLNEANVVFCDSSPWLKKDGYAAWCQSQTQGEPPAADYLE